MIKKIDVLKIEAMADKGVALGRWGGKAVFVRLAAPGDVVAVNLTEERDGWAKGEITKIIEPSPLRVTPACRHYGDCGGCSWQHISHSTEVEGKAASLAGFFKNRLGLGDEVFLSPIVSSKEYGYRNRLTLTIDRSSRAPIIGMAGLRSHRLVEIESCPVAAPVLNAALAKLRDCAKKHGILPAPARLLLQADNDDKVWATFTLSRPMEGGAKSSLTAWGRETGIGVWSAVDRQSPKPLHDDFGGFMPFVVRGDGKEMKLAVPVGCFAQANPEVSQRLVDRVCGLTPLYEGGSARDFYCGSGNFTLALALGAKSVTGIEGDIRAAGAAVENARAGGLTNVEIIPRPVEKVLGGNGARTDFWLLDPPRSGAPELAEASAGGPPAVFYISCDPATMVRDLKAFVKHGYAVESVQAADMFPRTSHLEVTALLKRQF